MARKLLILASREPIPDRLLVADYAISIAIQHEAVCRVPTLDRRDPMRARIGARNPFVSIGIPTADLRFDPAAPVVPFQDKTGSGIGFAAGLGTRT